MSPDARSAWITRFLTMSLSTGLAMVFPRLLPLHQMLTPEVWFHLLLMSVICQDALTCTSAVACPPLSAASVKLQAPHPMLAPEALTNLPSVFHPIGTTRACHNADRRAAPCTVARLSTPGIHCQSLPSGFPLSRAAPDV